MHDRKDRGAVVLDTVGAVGIACAPFTAGASLAVSVGVGVVGTTAGLGTSAITDWWDSEETKEFIQDLSELDTSRNEKLGQLGELLNSMATEIQKLVDKKNIDYVTATYKVIHRMGGGKKRSKWWKLWKPLENDIQDVQRMMCYVSTRTHGFPVALALCTTFGVIAAYLTATSKTQLPAIATTLAKMVGSITVKTAAKGLVVAGAIVYVLWDVHCLIEEWREEHEATGYAKKLVKNIEEQTEGFTSFLEILLGSRAALRSSSETKRKKKEEKCTCEEVKISVIYLNIHSMRPGQKISKMIKFRALIALTQPQLVALVETWLTKSESTEEIQRLWGLEGYTIYRVDRREPSDSSIVTQHKSADQRLGGGLLVAWREDPKGQLKFSEESDGDRVVNYHDSVQSYCIQRSFNCSLCNNGKTLKNYSFRLYYRRPSRFQKTQVGLPEETPAEFRQQDSEAQQILCEFYDLHGGYYRGGYDGGILAGDFNWTDPLRNRLAQIPWLRKLAMTGTFSSGGFWLTTPDGVFRIPSTVVEQTSLQVMRSAAVSDHAPIAFKMSLGKDYYLSTPCEVYK